MKDILDLWIKIDRVIIRLLLPMLAWAFGVSWVIGREVTIHPRSEIEGYALIVCGIGLVILPIVKRKKGGK